MLLIDCHEPLTIIKELEASIPVRVLQLKYGDYSYSDVIIERKTLSNFFFSLKHNRLKEQMAEMSRYYSKKYLLIEGFFDFDYVNNIDYVVNPMKKDKVYHAVKFFDINKKRLEILFSKFGSISNIAKADKKDFKGLKSIGKKTAEKIKQTLELNIFE